jgi:hypothetical protein
VRPEGLGKFKNSPHVPFRSVLIDHPKGRCLEERFVLVPTFSSFGRTDAWLAPSPSLAPENVTQT